MSEILLDWSAAAAAGPARAGGKGWQLGVLAELGLPVPPGFVIDSTVEAAREQGSDLSASLQAALALALESRGWMDVPLAVRSSASTEDSARASFAGIYRSCLNVRGHAALVEAVRSVLDSSTEPAATAYRERLGLAAEPARMAVVVMPLLPAVAAGVAFTGDPVSGREDQLLVHANWGLGESLVGGLVDADEYRLEERYPDENLSVVAQRRGTKARMTVVDRAAGTRLSDTPQALAAQTVLSPAQVIALGKLVRDAATALDYATPCYDVEWVWDGSAFWIVQARPITARGRHTYPALMQQPAFWSRGNSRDVVPDPLPALDRSLALPLINRILTRSTALAGYASLPGVQRTALYHGRVYFETSVLQWEAFDGFDVAPEAYNRMLGGHQPAVSVPPATAGQRLSRAWRGLRFLLRCVRPRLRAKTTLALAHATAAQRLAQHLPANPSELAGQLRTQVIAMRSAEDLLLLQAAGSALFVLRDTLETHFPGEGDGLTAALMSGGETSVTAAMSYDLMQLARVAEADAVALEWLQSPQRVGPQWRQQLPHDNAFGHALATFLQRYGHRAVHETYLHHPRWREDPDYLLDTVRGLIGCDAALLRDRQQHNAAAARRRIRQRVPIWQRARIPLLVKLAVAERNMREGARSALTAQAGVVRQQVLALGQHWSQAGDLPSREAVFHLTWTELLAVAEGRLAAAHAASRAHWRRRHYEEFLRQQAPEVIAEHLGAAATMSLSDASSCRSDSNAWRGIVVASGCATGPAHIAHHPAETLNLSAGAILVAPATDPSWTPAFLKAGAIVMETGGYLSHGAIVARELGIPAVVNLPGILDAIRTGDLLEVDANHGIVRRVQESAASRRS